MAELGISLSFSRPRVSNDNAFAESIFRSILSVREWVDQFIAWYNTEHRHSGIKYVTPNQRHFGLADNICEIRRSTYETAKRKHPKRWSRHIKSLQQPEIVKINHPSPIKSIEG